MNHSTPVKQAIALKYDEISPPKLSAKGENSLAEQIMQVAREHNIPIYENSDLVGILSKLDLGEEIPETLYRVIAEMIAFAYYLQGKVPKGFNPEQKR